MIKEILLKKGTSVREAMRAIDIGSVRTAFVISDEGKLVGSISDGDIRRGLLHDINMEDSILSVMNNNPLFMYESSDKEERIALIEEKDLSCLPILDRENKVIDIVTLRSLLQYEKKENPVFIMAGGFGTRLRPLTDSCPKPMLPVGSKPMLEHLVERLAKQGFYKFYLSTHYLPQIIKDHFGEGKKWGVEINYIHEDKPLGTAGALSLLPKNIANYPLLMMNGDVLTDLDFTKLIDFHSRNTFDSTMCLRELEHQVSYGVVDTEDNRVIGMREKPTYTHDINTGIYVLSKSAYTSVREGVVLDMPSFLEERISFGYKVGAMRHPGYWLDIGRLTDYQKAQRDIHEIFKSN